MLSPLGGGAGSYKILVRGTAVSVVAWNVRPADGEILEGTRGGGI